MEISTQEQRAILEVQPSSTQTFCILFWKKSDGLKAEKRVLRRINANGVPVSTKKYSEVFFYHDVRHSLTHAQFLLAHGYDVKIHKCNKRGVDKFWLT